MKLNLGNPEKTSISYLLSHNTWFKVLFFVWYKKIEIVGTENLKTKGPIILAPNHQNALMDALAVCGVLWRDIVWLARADIFNNKIAAKIFKTFKIMPAYRMQDGIKNIENNDIVFTKCVNVLEKNKIIALFPEATHWGFRRLRPTKKAAARIACQAEEAHDFNLGIQIVPVAIYFDNYTNVRRRLLVKFGKPIFVKNYKEAYKANPQQAQLLLKNDLEIAMKDTMLHIPHQDELYDTYDSLRVICEKQTIKTLQIKGKKIEKSYEAHIQIVKKLEEIRKENPEKIEKLSKDVAEYTSIIKKLNFRDWLIESQRGDTFKIIMNFIKLLIFSPVFIVGFVTHFLQFHYFNKFAKKIAKDPQFFNSLTFMFVLVTTPIIYLIYGITIIQIFDIPWWSFFIIYISLLYIAAWSLDYFVLAKKTFHMIRFSILQSIETHEIQSAIKLRKKIIKTFSTLSNNS